MTISQYKIMEKIIQGYNQLLPIMLFSTEHKSFDNEEVNNIIELFSLYIFKRHVSVHLSESNFAESL